MCFYYLGFLLMKFGLTTSFSLFSEVWLKAGPAWVHNEAMTPGTEQINIDPWVFITQLGYMLRTINIGIN